MTNVDLVLAKSHPITERLNLQFRAEAFNILTYHSNYTSVGRLLNTTTFGRVLGQMDPPTRFTRRANCFSKTAESNQNWKRWPQRHRFLMAAAANRSQKQHLASRGTPAALR